MTAITSTLAPSNLSSRTGLRDTLRHTGALIRRNLLSTKATPEELLDVTFFPIIMTVMFTYVFGGGLKSSTGGDYIEYLIPGIFVQMLSFGSIGVGIKLNSDFDKGLMDRFRSLPIARVSVLSAHLVSSVLRLLLASLITFTVATCLGFRVHTNVFEFFGGIALLLALGFGVSWLSVYVGTVVRSPQAVQGVLNIALFPLMFCSSIFTSVSTMPGWLQAFAKVNPLTTAADSARALMVGGQFTAGHDVWITLAWAAGMSIVFAPLALRAYNRHI
ncbi:ABC transporter permease [Actinospica sp. MGRD01-02]|uniref:Transport permease protein n=1 Tax=Actinospica acidithermotolerans TaxID=2828514 RepID=A0A941IHM0_9ACTN|nr:ABC transporter permease [Actinospica acidithermotolerans]MBR7827354.1 ABC transporter permease [Actinospica acidithermotolerans]